jgi:hypothetical protein
LRHGRYSNGGNQLPSPFEFLGNLGTRVTLFPVSFPQFTFYDVNDRSKHSTPIQ